jgi:hypothetical protein
MISDQEDGTRELVKPAYMDLLTARESRFFRLPVLQLNNYFPKGSWPGQITMSALVFRLPQLLRAVNES